MTRKSSPPVEPVDHRLGAGRIVPLGGVVGAAFSESDLVVLGDTDHSSGAVIDALQSQQLLVGAAEGGATHMLVEAAGDEPLRGELTRTCGQLGLQIHKIDPQSGEQKRGILYSDATPEQQLKQLSERLKQDSGSLSRNIRDAVPEGEKALLVYGAVHFTTEKDPRRLAGMDMVKIDVYENRAAFDESMTGFRQMNEYQRDRGVSQRVYANAPEAVYFADTGSVHTTADTPDWLRARLDAMGAPAPEQKPVQAEPAPAAEADKTPPPASGPAP